MPLEKKPFIIFDTDMDTDCDDAGALAILYEYVKRGKAELLGIIADSVSPYAAACCEALGKFYGVERPVGAVSSSEYLESSRLARYRKHSERIEKSNGYNRIIAESIGKRDGDYPSAASVYRRLLANAPDGSVTVVCVGLLTALAQLLQSEGDEISPLCGRELMRRKVEKVVSMGEPYAKNINFNWDMDGEGAKVFLTDCPVPVFVSSYGAEIVTGASLSCRLADNHLLRRIYEIYLQGEGKGRASWDLLAVLYALEPNTPYLKAVDRGDCRYQESFPHACWQGAGTRGDRDLVLQKSVEETAAYLERLLVERS